MRSETTTKDTSKGFVAFKMYLANNATTKQKFAKSRCHKTEQGPDNRTFHLGILETCTDFDTTPL